MRQSEDIEEIVPALVEVNKDLKNIEATADNPFFKSKYAGLDSYMNMVRPALTKNGLVLVQGVDTAGSGLLEFWSRILHTSGQWIESSIVLETAKHDPQAYGSLCTYGQRYSLKTLLAIAQTAEDDDGNNATFVSETATKKRSEKAPVKADTKLSKDQRRDLLKFADGHGVTVEGVKSACAKFGFASSADVTVEALPKIKDAIIAIAAGEDKEEKPEDQLPM